MMIGLKIFVEFLHHPGGTNVGGTDDPGVQVSARAKENLKLVIYYVKHQ